jgi:hypothetical protein
VDLVHQADGGGVQRPVAGGVITEVSLGGLKNLSGQEERVWREGERR